MLKFGYDQFNDDTWEVIKPNGLIGQKEIPETFRLYLPPWFGDIFSNHSVLFQVNSSKTLIKENNKDRWIYLIEPNGDPRGWFGQYTEEDKIFTGRSR